MGELQRLMLGGTQPRVLLLALPPTHPARLLISTGVCPQLSYRLNFVFHVS